MAFELTERLRGAFTENLNLKVLSFAFALVLYSLVHDSQDAQRPVDVGIVVRLPPDSMNRLLVSQSASKVRVTLRGARSALDDLHVDDLGSVQVDAHTGTEKHVMLEPAMVHVPPGVRVEQFDPPIVDLGWEDQVVRDVPVEVSLVGAPADGFVVHGNPLAEPVGVRVRGPQSEVMTLQHVRAEAFDVRGLGEGVYTRSLALDRRVGLKYDATEVKVTTEVTREMVERPFPRLAVAVLGPTKAHTQPAEVDVRLVCPPDILRSLRAEQVVPIVDVKSKDPSGSVSLPVAVSVEKCQAFVTPGNVIVRW